MEANEDFDSFLNSVDKVTELLMDLKTSDNVSHQAIENADCYIAAMDDGCRTKINKTRINTNPPPQPPREPQYENPEMFMKMMEKDAERRRLNRIAREKKATALKDKGNEAYALENYESAVKFYSDGLAIQKLQHLYTNRAQAYIRLGRYKEAVTDCEWALRFDERCIKAYLHMGKAYLGLKNYEESRRCFKKIVEIEPEKEAMTKQYLTHVDLEEERESQEFNAKQEFAKGEGQGITVPQILEKLSRPGQKPFFYYSGVQFLLHTVTDCTGQTLFRLNHGFSIISSNDTVRNCLLQKTHNAVSQQLCVSVLKLWRRICSGNYENQKTLLTCPVARDATVHLLTSKHLAVQKECLALLCLYSQTPNGRRLAIDGLNVHMLVRNLVAYISMPNQQQENTAVVILENFAVETKFCVQLRPVLTDTVTAPFASLLRNIGESYRPVLPSLVSAIGSLAQDGVIRDKLAHDSECWKAFVPAIRECIACGYKEVLYPILGLIVNLSAVTSPVIQEHAVSLCGCCQDLLRDTDGGVVTRAAGALSNVLPQSTEAVQHIIQGDVVRTMWRILKQTGETATKYAIKTLAVCTAASRLAREEVVRLDKKLAILRRLLGTSGDDVVTGNAALCMAHCLELEGMASKLLGTDVVQLLLRHAAGDATNAAVQQNAAIALGKLCQSEPRHINKLRELHGFEILHSCIKLIK